MPGCGVLPLTPPPPAPAAPKTANAAATAPRWPWALLGLALAWVALARVPIVLNAADHLDSDLAVDGITLREATRGQWRWHYPGTPHMGTLPVLLSLPLAAVRGADPIALVSGGAVAYGGLVVATFGLAWRGFGPRVAAWSLVPLAFASTGTLWLAGRITGGHLLTAAWHAAAFAGLHACLTRGGVGRAAGLGLWCGLGLYLDRMFAMSLVALVPAAVVAWWRMGRPRRGLAAAAAFAGAAAVGYAPHEIGARVEPHDAYREQFAPIFAPDVLAEHARLLLLDCLPRLVVGHRLPGLQPEPHPAALRGRAPTRVPMDLHPVAAATTALGLFLFLASLVSLARRRSAPPDPARAAVRWGLLGASAAVVAGFVLNRNIFNSDNYRYLVFLLVPWALGFGVLMDRLARRGWGGATLAASASLVLAALMTLDAARWYGRFGWIDTAGRPVRVAREDPALAWLAEHPEVAAIYGGYWDVYRLAYLSGAPVRGVPFPIYPDRFPEWSRGPAGGRPEVMLARPGSESAPFRARALAEGGRVVHRAPGLEIILWPKGVGS